MESRKPKIRFKGFTDPWEQRKLGDIAHTTIGEFVIRTKQKPNSPYPVYNGGTSYTGFYDEYNNEANQIVISARGANAGFVNIVRRRFWGGNSCYAVNFIDKENFDLDFTYQSIKNNQSGFIENQQAANIPSVSKSDVETFVFQCPKFNEQRQIGTFFAQLDDLITLHQRKLNALKNVKKSLLEKMFPKPGEFVPEIRFEGFTDPWEQRKFSDLYVANNERNANREYGYDRTLSIATMTFNGGNGASDGSLGNYKVIRVGDIAFEGHANKVHAYGRFVLNDAGDGLMSPRFSCLRPIVKQCYSFWKYYIPREETMRPILVKVTKSGTMMNELVPDDLMRESISVPCLAEQEVIGGTLTQLDHLITLHQHKLNALKNVKKSLLEKMFV